MLFLVYQNMKNTNTFAIKIWPLDIKMLLWKKYFSPLCDPEEMSN